MSDATIAARLGADLRFRAAPLDLRGIYRMLLDFADATGRVALPGLDATAAVAAALGCSRDESATVIRRAVEHGLAVVELHGVKLLVAATAPPASAAETRARAKRLAADFSYRGLADTTARRAWLATEAGRQRVVDIGMTDAEADALASTAGVRGRPSGNQERQSNARENARTTPEECQSSTTDRAETASSKAVENASNNARGMTEAMPDSGITPPSPSFSPPAPSEVLPSHTLPSPTSPNPPPTSPNPEGPGGAVEPAATAVPTIGEGGGESEELFVDASAGKPKASVRRARPDRVLPFTRDEALALLAEASFGRFVAESRDLSKGTAIAIDKQIKTYPTVAEWKVCGAWLAAGALPNRTTLGPSWLASDGFRDAMAQSRAWDAAGRPAVDRAHREATRAAHGFGIDEVIEELKTRAPNKVRLTAESVVIARLDGLVAEVSTSWGKANGEAVTRKHWATFAAWLDKGGEHREGGIASWWGKDRNGNPTGGADRPGLVYFLSDGRLAKHFEEAMEWRRVALQRRAVEARRKQEAEFAAARTTQSTQPAQAQTDERAAVQKAASEALATFKSQRPIGLAAAPMRAR